MRLNESNRGAVFPVPQEMTMLSQPGFRLDECPILVPEPCSEHDLFLARLLAAEMSDRFGLGLQIRRAAAILPEGRAIVIGSAENPLVRARCAELGIDVSSADPGAEGYVLDVREGIVLIAGSDKAGAFYGLQSLRQLIRRDGTAVVVPALRIRDRPHKPFRGLRLYLPGRENLAFFRRFVRDFCALYKFNTLILETNACMRLDRHPELNAGSVDLARDMDATRRCELVSSRGEYQNSSHHDAADGGILEKDEVAALVRYARAHHLEVIPEIPSLTHSFYLLARHRDLAEVQHAEWPDTYCPLNEASYDLLFEVMDEYIEVMQPRTVHIGHDEWRMPIDVCPRCAGRDYSELYIADLLKVYGYLRERGIRVAMWGDHLMESVRNKGPRDRVSALGKPYRVPGALSEQQVMERVPKDILIFNWFWSDSKGWLVPQGYRGEDNDLKLGEWGFEQVYGNMGPAIQNWAQRSARPGVLGGAPSSWAATTEANVGKDLVADFLGCANLLWSTNALSDGDVQAFVRGAMPGVRRSLRGRVLPSQWGDPIAAVDLGLCLNAPAGGEIAGQPMLRDLAVGELGDAGRSFRLADPALYGGRRAIVVGSEGREAQDLPVDVYGIAIGEDATSLLFLHACAHPGQNMRVYHQIYNPADTAELLGWYEVVYEDGYVETIPLRYGVNIGHWRGPAVYGADAVDCAAPGEAEPAWFYAYEWPNPRLGRVIRQVNLKGARGFRACQEWYGVSDQVVPSNAVVLLAVSVVSKRTP